MNEFATWGECTIVVAKTIQANLSIRSVFGASGEIDPVFTAREHKVACLIRDQLQRIVITSLPLASQSQRTLVQSYLARNPHRFDSLELWLLVCKVFPPFRSDYSGILNAAQRALQQEVGP
ncbi:MAG TPA: hypothetical protein VFO38_00815 [Candidatus Saccharimonadales bacterium]|nr:hypothetical protein [Candidatus Saccharimonadales bacterium]